MADRLAIAVLLLAALLVGCGAQAPAGFSAPASATERRPADQQSAGAPATGAPAGQDTTMSETIPTDGLPEDLREVRPLWEVSNAGSHTAAASRTRLYPDGRLFQWSDMRRREVNGFPRRERAVFAWRLDALVSPAGLEQVRGQIPAFEQLDPAPATPGADQPLITWRSSLDGREHSVTLPSDATDRLPDPIRAIERAIQTNVVPGGVPIEQ